jgi:hypothetical protein
MQIESGRRGRSGRSLTAVADESKARSANRKSVWQATSLTYFKVTALCSEGFRGLDESLKMCPNECVPMFRCGCRIPTSVPLHALSHPQTYQVDDGSQPLAPNPSPSSKKYAQSPLEGVTMFWPHVTHCQVGNQTRRRLYSRCLQMRCLKFHSYTLQKVPR